MRVEVLEGLTKWYIWCRMDVVAVKLKVTLVRSPIHRPQSQKATVRGLGLRRLQQSRILDDSPAIRGMIRKVHHLVKVESADESRRPSKKILGLLAAKNRRRGMIVYHPHHEYVDAAIVGRIAGMIQHWDSLEDIADNDEDYLDPATHELAKETGSTVIVKRQHLLPQAHIKRFLPSGETQVWALHHRHNTLRRKAPRDHSFCAHRFWSQSAETSWMKAMEDLFLLALPDLPGNIEDPIIQETLSDYWALCRARLRVLSKAPRAYNFPEITRVRYDQETRDREELSGRVLYSDRGDETRGIVDALIGVWVDQEVTALQEKDVVWGVVDVDDGEFVLPDFWAGSIIPISPSRIVQAYKRGSPEYRPLARARNLDEVNEFLVAHSKYFVIARNDGFLREVQARRGKR